MSKLCGTVIVGLLLVSTAACSGASSSVAPSAVSRVNAGDGGEVGLAAQPDYAPAAKPGNRTIVEIVVQPDGEFDVLQAAVVKAGLVDLLNGKNQYTVFAPTDAAFVKTLGVANEAAAIAAVEGLPVDQLANILGYHITAGRRTSRSVLAAPSYHMLNGSTLTRAALTAAGIAATDISASNGIVHVINSVLLP
jgi:uncharacterized surface protein with fasciclin (FAS1) repeats